MIDMTQRLEHLVFAQAKRTPNAIAVVDGAQRCSYGELDDRADRLARTLLAAGVGPGDRVCLLLPKSIEAIVAILAVLKAGACYVPLDVSSPPSRLGKVLRSCRPCWLVARGEAGGLVERCFDESVRSSVRGICWLGNGSARFDAPPSGAAAAPDPGGADDAESLAYIMFTSGSTGEPKGVPITHASVGHFVSWANEYFDLGPDDRISGHAPLHFDVSAWDVFGSLTAGAQLHLVPPQVNLLPTLTTEFIGRAKLTQWFSVPSALIPMMDRDLLSFGDFPDLRRIIWVGEVFPVPALRYWMRRLPHVQFTNLYGPTETTIASSYHTVRAIPTGTDPPVPIGVAIPGERLAVLDERMRPVDIDVIGDLYIGGAGLSPGYWRDPAKTAEAFRQTSGDPFGRWYRTGDLARMDAAGVVHFHGRADRQLKVRGHRIELDEVADALCRLASLSASAVVSVPAEAFAGPEICAAYVLRPGVERSPADLRAELADSLPTYMLPTRWLSLESLPTGTSGKVDHREIERRFLAVE